MKFLLTGVFLLCLVSVGALSFAESDRGILVKKITARMMAMADKVMNLSPETWDRLEPKLDPYFEKNNEDRYGKGLLLHVLMLRGGEMDDYYRRERFEYGLEKLFMKFPLAELEAIERDHLLVAEKSLDKLLRSVD